MSDTASTTATDAPQTGEPHGTGTGEGGEQTSEPTIESLQAEIESLKGHSRKWEDRAKENKKKADELDAMKRERMTDDEKAQAHVAEIEQRAKDAEDRAAKAEAALTRYVVAAEFGLSKEDAEALSAVSDEAALRTLAERLAGRSSTGPKPNPAQGRGKTAPSSPAEAFADALGDLF